MKLFLLIRHEEIDYDTYDSCVVCAKDKKDAKTIPPNYDPEIEPCPPGNCCWGEWTDTLENIEAIEIGTAKRGMKRGVILASYNAG